jgi:hypothetical protein
MASAGVVVGAAALPGAAVAASTKRTTPAPLGGLDGWSWADFRTGLLPGLRAAYLAEVERFTEDLRPRFEAGELGKHGHDEEYDARMAELEQLCRDRFGLEVTTRRDGKWVYYYGDREHACLILAASPAAADDSADLWEHECDAAHYAVAQDVLRIAQDRGWCGRTA